MSILFLPISLYTLVKERKVPTIILNKKTSKIFRHLLKKYNILNQYEQPLVFYLISDYSTI